MASGRKLDIATKSLENGNSDEHVEDDAVSSLGDASPMNTAEERQKRRQKAMYCKLASFFGIAICSLIFSLLNNKLNDYMNKPESSTTTNAKEYSVQDMRTLHIERVASSMAHPFLPVASNIWCIDARLKYEQAKRRPMGLSYLRIPRAASSTLSGINQRIARNFAARTGLKKNCIRHDGRKAGPYYSARDPLSFLWTFVRDPTQRAMSRIGVSLKKQRGILHNTMPLYDYSEEIVESLKTADDVQFGVISAGRGGFQLQYSMLSIIDEWSAFNTSEPTKVKDPKKVQDFVREVVKGYNFIGLVERFDESLVALQLILGLEPNDMLYFAVKSRKHFELNPKEKVCLAPLDWNELLVGKVNQHLESDEWFAQNYGDHLLYQAVNMSLDQTILSLGLDVFSKALKDFKRLLRQAEESCHPIFPCSFNGTLQQEKSEEDCYEGASCGYKCLDDLPLH
mmetsp:Transcript_39488/g.95525  ORF Transcript_39488/g.95525 Transcript_39488/m.95525 type:complete len:454 (+) Transcript_39488:59-1420(+)